MFQNLASSNECPGLCKERPWHPLGKKNNVTQNEKKLCGFSYSKNMPNFEAFQ